MLCRHCPRNQFYTSPRRLCHECESNPAIRERYPVVPRTKREEPDEEEAKPKPGCLPCLGCHQQVKVSQDALERAERFRCWSTVCGMCEAKIEGMR